MLYVIDTCFWTHLKSLFDKGNIDIRPIFEDYRWGMTKEIEKELVYYQLTEFIPIEQAQIIPITEKEWNFFSSKDSFLETLDKADQSLILIAMRDNECILTDDNAIFLEAQALGIPVFLLPLFIVNQAKFNVLSKKDARSCFAFWIKNKFYPQKELKRWKTILET
jgi:predicted nucleic acid-binding protein